VLPCLLALGVVGGCLSGGTDEPHTDERYPPAGPDGGTRPDAKVPADNVSAQTRDAAAPPQDAGAPSRDAGPMYLGTPGTGSIVRSGKEIASFGFKLVAYTVEDRARVFVEPDAKQSVGVGDYEVSVVFPDKVLQRGTWNAPITGALRFVIDGDKYMQNAAGSSTVLMVSDATRTSGVYVLNGSMSFTMNGDGPALPDITVKLTFGGQPTTAAGEPNKPVASPNGDAGSPRLDASAGDASLSERYTGTPGTGTIERDGKQVASFGFELVAYTIEDRARVFVEPDAKQSVGVGDYEISVVFADEVLQPGTWTTVITGALRFAIGADLYMQNAYVSSTRLVVTNAQRANGEYLLKGTMGFVVPGDAGLGDITVKLVFP